MKTIETKENPWLGLQSYSEGQILYGRDSNIRELTQCVISDKETLLYGKSGIGKSSILNAGVIPNAERKGYLPVPVRLDHKKGESYLSQIRTEIAFQMAKRYGDENGIGIVEMYKSKSANYESIYEFFHRHIFRRPSGERIKLLIIFDQFEEIFTLQEKESVKKEFFAELADFLNDILPTYLQTEELKEDEFDESKDSELRTEVDLESLFEDFQLSTQQQTPVFVTDNDIHLVFTIREDFLSEFEYYTALIPSLKNNRYGLRPLNEEQAAQIILRPIPGMVSTSVAKLIIEKVTNKTDFDIDGIPEIEVDSAVLSLYMNRLYDAKIGDTITTELVEEKGSGIIKQFYYSVIETMDPQKVEFLEERLLNSQNRRENVTEYDVLHYGHFTPKELNELCEGDKKILRKFYLSGDMRIEYIHDILCPVIKEHKEERLKQRQEEADRIKQEEEKRRFVAEEKAKREKIEREAKLEQERLKEEANQIRIKTRKKISIISYSFAGIFIIIFGWFIGWKVPYSVNYVSFTIVNGRPVGIGEPVGRTLGDMISTKLATGETEENNFFVLYKLTRNGLWSNNPFHSVEVITPKGEKTNNMLYEITPAVGLIETEFNDKKARAFAIKQRQTSSWSFSSNICTAYNIKGEVLYSIQYYRDNSLISSDSTKYTQWAIFNDENGKQMMVTDNGMDRIQQTVRNRHITGCLFYTELGVPQPNAYGAYGYSYDFDGKDSLPTIRYEVDKFGRRKEETAFYYHYDKFGRVDSTSAFKIKYPQLGMQVFEFADYSDTLLFNSNGTLSYGRLHPFGGEFSLLLFKYDENGRPLMNKKYKGTDVTESTIYYYSQDLDRYDSIRYLSQDKTYVEHYMYPDTNTIVTSFWQNGERCEITMTNEYDDAITYHMCKKTKSSDSIYTITTTEYLDTLEHSVKSNSYSKYAIYKLKNGREKLEYYYDNTGEIYKSEWFDYDDYGNRIARAVAGIDYTPIRCPKWDWDSLAYYKMAYIKDFSGNTFVSVQGIDEFGEDAYIVSNDSLFIFSELPISRMSTEEVTDTNHIKCYGLKMAYNKRVPMDKNEVKVPFLHLLNKEGTMYSACIANSDENHERLFDGDIIFKLGNWKLFQSASILLQEWNKLIKNGGEIQVLQVQGNTYIKKSFNINAGNIGAEYYFLPITQSHYQKIIKL